MAYATLKNAKDLYGETYVLTSVDRDADGEPDWQAFTKALNQASSEMDSYLGARYDVPVDPIPSVVNRYCIDIAIFLCSADASTGTDSKRQRYEDAIKWLTNVAKGVVTLGLETEDEPDGENPIPQLDVDTDAGSRLFTRTKMRGLI